MTHEVMGAYRTMRVLIMSFEPLSHTGESAVLDARVVTRADGHSSAARGPPAALDILT